MDWSKAKSILIIVFLLLNIFLLYIILSTNSNLQVQTDYIRYAKEYLSSKNITLEVNITDRNGKAGKIVYGDMNYDMKKLARLVFNNKNTLAVDNNVTNIVQGEEKIVLDRERLLIEDRVEKGAEWFADTGLFQKKLFSYLDYIGFKKSGLYLKTFEIKEEELKAELLTKYKNGLLFDQIITASLSSDGFLSLSLPACNPKRESDQEEILSAYQVLVMGKLTEGANVSEVQFGYKQISKDDFYETPVWYITINGEAHFYNAYTGEKTD